jgi:hypothetical protein
MLCFGKRKVPPGEASEKQQVDSLHDDDVHAITSSSTRNSSPESAASEPLMTGQGMAVPSHRRPAVAVMADEDEDDVPLGQLLAAKRAARTTMDPRDGGGGNDDRSGPKDSRKLPLVFRDNGFFVVKD